MNPMQQQFYSFVLEKACADKKDEANKLLNECFVRQDKGTFDFAFMTAIVPQILNTISPEFKEEVQNVMSQFGSQMKK